LPLRRKESGKVLILIEWAEQITHSQIGGAFGASGTGHASGFFGNGSNRLGMQRHGTPSDNELPAARATCRSIVSPLSRLFANDIMYGRASFSLLRTRVLYHAS
jgi:hypothetical protein